MTLIMLGMTWRGKTKSNTCFCQNARIIYAYLRYVGHGLDSQRPENVRHRLHDLRVVLRQRGVSHDAHEGGDGHGRVELGQAAAGAHVDQQLARAHLPALLQVVVVADGDQGNAGDAGGGRSGRVDLWSNKRDEKCRFRIRERSLV